MRTFRFLCYLLALACFAAALALAKRNPVRSAQLLAAGLALVALYLTVSAAQQLD